MTLLILLPTNLRHLLVLSRLISAFLKQKNLFLTANCYIMATLLMYKAEFSKPLNWLLWFRNFKIRAVPIDSELLKT